MPFHFDAAEYAARRARATQAVKEAGLDALILFAPESHYWIRGYDTFGFAMYQAMVLTAKGDLHLMTRMLRPRPGERMPRENDGCRFISSCACAARRSCSSRESSPGEPASVGSSAASSPSPPLPSP